MSMRHLPYLHDCEVDYTAAYHEERRRLALKALDPGDVLSVLDDLLAQEPDPTKHPCFGLINWLLDRQRSVDGGNATGFGTETADADLTPAALAMFVSQVACLVPDGAPSDDVSSLRARVVVERSQKIPTAWTRGRDKKKGSRSSTP